MNTFKLEGSKRPRSMRLWKNLKRYLNPKQINILACCGSSSWVLDHNSNTGEQPLIFPEDDQSPTLLEPIYNTLHESYIIGQNHHRAGHDHNDSPTTMNLATALAAERSMESTDRLKMKPLKSIVRLFEEEEVDGVKTAESDQSEGGIGTLCCLCTERNKGAALIPCGHTYCRVCSRSMWSKQGLCPLCNCLIKEILEIF
uniref:uncharacterized protein LOC122598401 n=1 Tax=Erigeron canadensis TaxID=72917 RepID=UPI001CB8AEDD|nr:uncharacterized protein LOC122598401 [Erigeron canadensis]